MTLSRIICIEDTTLRRQDATYAAQMEKGKSRCTPFYLPPMMITNYHGVLFHSQG